MGHGGHASQSLPIVKPECDKLHYGSMVLENGLQAVLISDEKADKSSAALDVRVGSLSDPVELPGLAHFLEHMLFYSNEKYPQEDAYSKFISEHGGSTNAFTAAEDTNYYFEVNHDHLDAALDRFAQFFICPLISEDGVAREANAVDSEHGKNVPTDAWRFNQVWRATANQDHPYSRFHTGNLETLITLPKAKGVSTHQAVREFAKQMYSANLMRLVVYGRESIADLKALVAAKFSEVVDKGLDPPHFSGDVLLAEQRQRLIKVVPQKETDSLVLQWPIEPQCLLYETLPSSYLSHLLGHEGEGSVFAVLKAKGWATQLSAGESGDSFSGRSFFTVSVILTKEGNLHAPEVAGLICAYIHILKQPGGVTQERFEEMQALSRMRFNFSDKLNPGRLTSALSQTLQHVPAHHSLLALHHVPAKYDPAGIEKVLAALEPDNLRIMWSSQDFKGETQSTESWYGTEYSSLEMPQSWQEQLRNPKAEALLHLPKENPFIPTDFTMLQAEEEGKSEDDAVVAPRIVHSSPLLELHHKQETSFGTPKAVVYLAFHSPEAYVSPEAAVLTRLLVKLLDDRLSELSYDAELAGLGYSILNTTYGFLVSFSGYNHKMMELVKHVLSAIVSLQVDQDRFQVQKEAAAREYANKKFEQPYQTAMYASSVAQEFRRWHTSEYQAVIDNLTASDAQAMAGRLLRRVWVQGYASGNLASSAAIELGKLIEHQLQEEADARPIFASQRDDPRVVKLRPGKPALVDMPVPNPSNDNSAIILSYQVGPDDLSLNVLSELWVRCTRQEAFHRLRSQQQLGYIVFLTTTSNLTIRSLAFILQSTAYPATTLEERCEEFLEDALRLLNDMTDQEFKQHVEELAKAKLEAPKRLREQAAKEWREIDDGTLKFDRRHLEVAALRSLTRAHLLHFFKTHVYDFSTRRKLAVRVQGATKEATAATAGSEPSNGATAAVKGSDAASANGGGEVGSTTTAVPEGKDDGGEGKGGTGRKTREGAPQPEVITDVWAYKRRQELYPSHK